MTWDDVSACARDHESTWDLDPGAAGSNWGIHRADSPPHDRLLGPVHPRGPACGLVAVGDAIVHHWGDIDRADLTFSVAKTYLAMLAGIAHRDGLLPDVDQPVVRSVPGIGFDDGANRQITWRHLLHQTSEWEGSCFGVPDQVDRYRRVSFQPPPQGEAAATKGTARPLHPPGEYWEYNDVRINQLSLALLHRFREPLPEVFARALAGPAGCSAGWRWRGYDNSWIELGGRRMQSVPGGTHWGGGVSIGARDQWRIARLLMGDRPDVMPGDWVRAMRTPVALAPFYGYLTWLNGDRQVVPSASPAAFFAIGAGSSVIWHEPARDLVAVIRWIEADAVDGLVSLIGKVLDGE
ncbi:MAG: serine hydrolase [Burkholderiaceae bacterium]